ncbi:MAG: chloride channel protein [Leptodesmis sp.]|uniref:chloride channel protein n=1 Tax=Leptodesmis sp. TaxID=3100501 RepID=UPI003D0A9A8E
MARIEQIFRNRFLQLLSRPKRLAAFEACLIGLVSGLAAVALGQSVGWLGGWRQQLTHLVPAYLALPMVGFVSGFLAGWLVEDVAPGSSGSGMAEVKAVLAKVPMPLDLRLALVKWVSATLVLAAGMPLGREGPTVQIGAALANQFSQWFPTSPDHRRQLIAAGAGAGLAAAFDAPIAGVLFVVEELLQDVSGITLGTAILASFVASAIARLSGSHSLDLDLRLTVAHASFSVPEVPFYLLLGILAGSLGVLFNRGVLTSLTFYRRFLPVALFWRVGLVGLVTGLALAALPSVFRDNAGIRQLLLSGDANWQLVAIVFCIKFGLIAFAGGSGAPGGLLIPSMTLGSALGYLVGSLEVHWLGLGLPTTYAHVGMAAFFCAVSRVPITAVVIVFEMTTDFNLVLPLMIGSVTAYLVAERLETGSLYDRLLEAKGIHLSESMRAQDPWTALTATQVMQPKVETLSSQMSVNEALQIFSHSSHRTFPVLEAGRLVGMLSQKDITNLPQRGMTDQISVATIMTPEPIRVAPADTLARVLHLLERHQLNHLPVADRGRLVGIITPSDIIRVQVAYLNGREDLLNPKVEHSHVIYQTRAPATGQGQLLVLLSNPKTAETLLKMAVAIAHDRHYELEVLHIIIVPRHQSLIEAPVRTTMGQRLLRSATCLGQAWQVPVHTQIRVAHDLSEAILQTLRTYHIDLVLMGWKGSTTTPGRIFSRVVDTVMQKAACKVMLVKLSAQPQFDRWLVPIGGGPNAESAIQLLSGLITLSPKPLVTICQVFESANPEPDQVALRQAAAALQQQLKTALVVIPIYGSSIPKAILGYAQQDHSDVIVLGASRESVLQQVAHGNTPAAISYHSNQTVILLRADQGWQ